MGTFEFVPNHGFILIDPVSIITDKITEYILTFYIHYAFLSHFMSSYLSKMSTVDSRFRKISSPTESGMDLNRFQ
ncbi:hypothetical protein CA11_11340 [Gimesia maris]|uniref:Uncharacterized protein n=1 Tax=Gimesia maris TaxID=122 RepID=A0A3D3RA55_9PLAN|nr:hypothetical protein [Gimesia sp.]QDT77688.1 hypothetical protein Mal35_11160 [Gimesia maris]QDU13351.1 hypothetical protein CA11_11340 [Gimesia maris]HCO25669.1 hypothetical protein [Gimesia maris]